ncbi:hypothetical protein AB205_0194870, partial [Aquarana catesbeiana]
MSPSESPLHQGPYGNPPYMRVPMKVPLIAGVPIRLALYIRVPFRVPPYQDPPYIRSLWESPLHQGPHLSPPISGSPSHQVSLTESLLHQDPYGNPSYIRVPMKVPLISSVPIRLALYIREGPHQRPPISGSPLHQSPSYIKVPMGIPLTSGSQSESP